MRTHDIHDESTPEPRDERRCEHHAHDDHHGHGRRHGAGHHRDGRPERAPFGGVDAHRAFGHPMGHGDRGFGPRRPGRPFGPGFGARPFGPAPFGPRPEGAADDSGERHGRRQRWLDRRILRTARIVAVAEHRAGREAVERTMAASVSHADHETTMRTLRTLARAVRTEHLPEHRHGRRHGGPEAPAQA